MVANADFRAYMSPSTHPTYRPDIDGLRAIAVLLVVAYHAFPAVLRGGFVGVDVFFIISGFLISGTIFQDLAAGTFSFANFYGRRVRRIFPALFIVLTATLLLGWLFLFPSEFSKLGAHVLAGAGFVSNLLLWHEAGYFDPASKAKPLLHLWSLGIEEQFYIFFPLLLAGLWQRRSRLLFWIVAIAAFSFLINIMGMRRDPVAVFYAPVTRVWELMLGALLAYAAAFRPALLESISGSAHRSALLTLIGTGLLLAAACLLDRGKQFPGWWALLPTLGAAAVIAAGPHAWFNREVLSHPLLVFVGLISYPLYLWHWPLLSYLSICTEGQSAPTLRAAAVVLSLAMAWLTYRLIEIPIRRRRWPKVNAPLLASAVAALAVAGCAINWELPQTRLDRFGELTSILKAFDDWDYPDGKVMVQGKVPGTVLFIGDSFLQHYHPRLKFLAETSPNAYSIRYAGVGGCPPLPDISRVANPNGCVGQNRDAYAEAMQPDILRVVFGSAWHYFYPIATSNKSMDPRQFERTEMMYVKGDASKTGIRPGTPAFKSTFGDFGAIVASLIKAGKKVYIVLPTPISDELDPHRMIDRWSNRRAGGSGVAKAEYLQANAPVMAELQRIARESGAILLDPARDLCGIDFCGAFFGKDPIYKDIGHIRPYYARQHITVFDPVVIAP